MEKKKEKLTAISGKILFKLEDLSDRTIQKGSSGCKRFNFSTFSGNELKIWFERTRSYHGQNIREMDNYNKDENLRECD